MIQDRSSALSQQTALMAAALPHTTITALERRPQVYNLALSLLPTVSHTRVLAIHFIVSVELLHLIENLLDQHLGTGLGFAAAMYLPNSSSSSSSKPSSDALPSAASGTGSGHRLETVEGL
ncbi:hypothetical protein E2C01_021717 [Portunus trituberculatus]|uniref:Uncharacterized protein n=1 Tax=Portunus trituberculatus TaxID=210409 RepID=A0A5B7E3C2_PORTR|nr:hypothetical protein [Portunus trituberculatus]